MLGHSEFAFGFNAHTRYRASPLVRPAPQAGMAAPQFLPMGYGKRGAVAKVTVANSANRALTIARIACVLISDDLSVTSMVIYDGFVECV